MSLKYNRGKKVLDDISTIIESNNSAIDDVITKVGRLKSIINGLPDKYGPDIQIIETEATNLPNDEAWQDLKRQKDKQVDAFNQLATRINDIEAAIGGL